MHIIIVGAGPVGDSLTGLALKLGHDVAVIEEDETRAEAAADKHDALVLKAAIAEADIMEEAGARKARALIAATSDDSANLMAMVLGQEYEIENLISVVNHKYHSSLFDRLGVRTLVDPEVLVAQHLLDLVLHPTAEDVTTLSDREQIYELRLSPDSEFAGLSFAEIDERKLLPKHIYIISVSRGDRNFFPRAETTLQAGDELIVFARKPPADDVLRLFTGDGPESR
jgi:trk system potassium uptake protein TrkA